MSDEQVLNMPARRFWSMETQISRINAVGDLQSISNQVAVNSKENLDKRAEELTLVIGEVAQVIHKSTVQAEPGAINRLKSLR